MADFWAIFLPQNFRVYQQNIRVYNVYFRIQPGGQRQRRKLGVGRRHEVERQADTSRWIQKKIKQLYPSKRLTPPDGPKKSLTKTLRQRTLCDHLT